MEDGFSLLDACPAGRAHYAWGGHFVTCIPVGAMQTEGGLPLVGAIFYLKKWGTKEKAVDSAGR